MWRYALQPIPRHYPYHTESVWYGCRLGLAWAQEWGSLTPSEGNKEKSLKRVGTVGTVVGTVGFCVGTVGTVKELES